MTKVIILAGGLGTRLQDETRFKPKPMVEIGGYPILWHIMNIYDSYGYREFTIALGYKAYVIKDYFFNYKYQLSDFSVHLADGSIDVQKKRVSDWVVHLIDTGVNTGTGGRLKQLASHIGNETFMMTYGDGVSSINIRQLMDFHHSHGKLVTLTSVHPPARFGCIDLCGDRVVYIGRSSQANAQWINGGFFVIEPEALDYIQSNSTAWEQEPLQQLAAEGQLMAYRHHGFWQCVDTPQELHLLETMWQEGQTPWKVWD